MVFAKVLLPPPELARITGIIGIKCYSYKREGLVIIKNIYDSFGTEDCKLGIGIYSFIAQVHTPARIEMTQYVDHIVRTANESGLNFILLHTVTLGILTGQLLKGFCHEKLFFDIL